MASPRRPPRLATRSANCGPPGPGPRSRLGQGLALLEEPGQRPPTRTLCSGPRLPRPPAERPHAGPHPTACTPRAPSESPTPAAPAGTAPPPRLTAHGGGCCGSVGHSGLALSLLGSRGSGLCARSRRAPAGRAQAPPTITWTACPARVAPPPDETLAVGWQRSRRPQRCYGHRWRSDWHAQARLGGFGTV